MDKSRVQFIATFLACCLVATGLVIIFMMIKSQNIAEDNNVAQEEKKQNNQQGTAVPLRQLPVITVGKGSETLPIKTNIEMNNLQDKIYLQVMNDKGNLEIGFIDKELKYVALQTLPHSASNIKLFEDETVSYITREGTFNDEAINIAFKDSVYKLPIQDRTVKIIDYIYSLEEHIFYVIVQNINNDLELGYVSADGEYVFVSNISTYNSTSLRFISLNKGDMYLESGNECYKYDFSSKRQNSISCNAIIGFINLEIEENKINFIKEDKPLYQLNLGYSDLRITNDEISWVEIDTDMEIGKSKKLYFSKLNAEDLNSISLPSENVLFAGKIGDNIMFISKSFLGNIYVYEENLDGELEESEEFEGWYVLQDKYSYIDKVFVNNKILPSQ